MKLKQEMREERDGNDMPHGPQPESKRGCGYVACSVIIWLPEHFPLVQLCPEGILHYFGVQSLSA